MHIDFSKELNSYLALRESLGVPTYQIAPLLGKFVQYLDEHCRGKQIKVNDVLDWVCVEHHSVATQHVHLSAARVFLKYLKAIVPETEIPSTHWIARRHRPEPFVFTDHQLLKLLDTAGELDSRMSLAAVTVQTMLGLMACTGLRPGETMRLRSSQVFLSEVPARILISRTKFGKSRWVPLHNTTVDRLRSYINVCPHPGSETFFTSKQGKPINRITLHRIFQHLISKIGLHPRKGQMRPTLHSLRHTFAVNRLLQWYSEGIDVRALLPNLSVYIGHIDPVSSYWYLSCTPQLMTAAAQRFELYGSRGGRNEEE